MTPSALLECEKLPLITHPYVWSFSGLKKRFSADATLALAVIHYLVIGSRIPMEEALPSLLDLPPHGRDRVRAADGSADQPIDRARRRRGGWWRS